MILEEATAAFKQALEERNRAREIEKASSIQSAKQRLLHAKLSALREEHDAKEAIRRAVLEERERKEAQMREMNEKQQRALTLQKKKDIQAFQENRLTREAEELARRAEAERCVQCCLV